MELPSAQGLRCGALAVSVLHDVDLRPGDGGLTMPGTIDIDVSWHECVQALEGADPESSAGHERLARWLLARRWIADRHLGELAELVRPVGLPPGHHLHPGPEWVRFAVPGGALDLGLGVLGLDRTRPDSVVVVAPAIWSAAGVDPSPWWAPATSYLGDMCRIAVDRRRRSAQAPLRPMGDCDVVTLLGCSGFRVSLLGPGESMAAMAAPMRDRGWTDLRRIDPAFVVAAAAATDPERRGFIRPLLITADEVTMVGAGGRPARDALADAAPDEPWPRPVRYR